MVEERAEQLDLRLQLGQPEVNRLVMKDGLLEDLPLPCVLDGLLNDVVHSGQDWRWHGIIFNTAEMCYLPLVRDALVWINQARQANTSVRSSKNSTNSFLRILAKTTLIQIKSKQLLYKLLELCVLNSSFIWKLSVKLK